MMRNLKITCLGTAVFSLIVSGIPLPAQTDAPAAPVSAEPQVAKLSDTDLDTLLAPIALYPDPLLAQILPASTEPGDIVMAARYIASGKDASKIDAQPWEESVKALAHYPDVLKMMDSKLDWTTHLGEAFIAQPEDVFNSVQRLRAKAQQAGNLKETPQQTIVVEKEVIKIMPADPQVIYVPQYPPETVYVQQPADVVTPLITFGLGLAMGAWIHNELDWHNHGVYYHNNGWHGGHYSGGGNNINIDNSNNINIGNGNGNNIGNGNRPGNGNGGGSAWKPQQRPSQLPSYGNTGNRPGNGDNGIGNGNRPNGGNGNGIQRPNNKPTQLPANGNNRPSSGGGQNRPSQRPQQRPSTLPTQAGNRRNGGNQFQRESSKPMQSMGNRGGGNRSNGGGRAAGGGGGRSGGGGLGRG